MATQPVQTDPSTATQLSPKLDLTNDEDEVTHVVCCRDPVWHVALCGQQAETINLTPGMVCTMCIEVALQRLPSFLDNDHAVCPMDHQPCPDEHDIDLRILREVTG